jgi:uncharacterized pyridoxamine 5'-phosphate oxidase family protein
MKFLREMNTFAVNTWGGGKPQINLFKTGV